MNSGSVVLGATVPRIWTPPLRELTPETSYGFDVIDFARDVLGEPLDPWQEWVVIHAGELLPDGRPRFRTVLILVARQQGKTHLLKVLSLYWMFVELRKLVLSTSTNLDYAREVWQAAVDIAETNEYLSPEVARVIKVNGEQALITTHGTRYKIAASNRKGGRSLTIDRLVLDELREHNKWDAWNASTNATNAIPDAQIYCLSNQGDNTSIVLDSLRDSAVGFIETGQGDWRLGIFEYSAPQGSDPTDLQALAQANPQLGRRTDPDALMGAAIRAKAAGGEELAGFKTEVMCMRVHLIDPAIDPDAWDESGTDSPLDLAAHRTKVALCVDVSLDGMSAALVAAAVLDGKVHCEVIESWDGPGCTKRLRSQLPSIVKRVRPRALGWFPQGPAAAIAADLQGKATRDWPPRGVTLVQLTGELASVCMGLAEQVKTGDLVHPNDPMLTSHVKAAQKLRRGEVWTYTRRGQLPISGAYALAGAVHLARELPPGPSELAVL
jgi:hypothetical protein